MAEREPSAVRKAVVFAAGIGTRLLPATKAIPKEMVPIVDRPAMHYVVDEIIQSGITDILVVTGRRKTAIEDYFDDVPEIHQALSESGKTPLLQDLERLHRLAEVHFIRQVEPLGTGHALLRAEVHASGEAVAVLFGDDLVLGPVPALAQLLEARSRVGGSILAVHRVPRGQLSRFGVIAGDPTEEGLWRVRDVVEKPETDEAPSDLALLGRYVFDPAIFTYLHATAPQPNGEVYLTDAILALSREEPVWALPIDGQWHTVGDPQSFLAATIAFALARPDIAPDFRAYLRTLLTDGS
jgi:UTP--glucose-1-phosphate uridylyltransferase